MQLLRAMQDLQRPKTKELLKITGGDIYPLLILSMLKDMTKCSVTFHKAGSKLKIGEKKGY